MVKIQRLRESELEDDLRSVVVTLEPLTQGCFLDNKRGFP
jgi:hypothetical protein